ncbi:serine hydrolase [Paraglaciecola sp. 25GB23A]|jgi:CubicO group peptidase (beta-lactamase class C family)|uniref:serine hydrolase n=1 Tax=Paraglaciecola sp. 25GB23A TaxID=3156068 RepID=UPI0032AF1F32
MPKFSRSFLLLITLVSINLSIRAQEFNQQKVHDIMQHFQVPGAAIGIIKNGQVIAAQGFGVKTLGKDDPVDADSIFKIASNTKAFTSAALAILVDEGKINWNGKVQSYLSDFKLYDPWVSQHFNLIDLLTHRSGLGLGAGDLMLWPEPSSFSRQEVLHNLRYLKPTGEFRADYAYDNLLYIVAGEIIPAVTGQSWENFVEQRIMHTLGMTNCFAGKVSQAKQQNVATPHGIVNGQLQTIIRSIDSTKPSVSGPAGGIQCSLNDMLRWVKVQLSQGKIDDTQRLFSAQQHKMMWQAQTIMPLSTASKRRDNSHFSAYALGWRVNDMDGTLQVHHTGSLAGMYSFVSLFPELDLGFVVLTNQQSSAARSALMYSVMKPYLGDTQTDWLAQFSPKPRPVDQQTVSTKGGSQFQLASIKTKGNKDYIGVYDDPWLGRFIIENQEDGALQVHSIRVEKLIGSLFEVGKDSLLIRWHDRSLEADAIISFKRDSTGEVSGMSIAPESSNIDFSYDFQDLDFTKVKNP